MQQADISKSSQLININKSTNDNIEIQQTWIIIVYSCKCQKVYKYKFKRNFIINQKRFIERTMQQLLASLIYYTVVVFIPLRQTYLAYKNKADNQTFGLWGNYWAIYCFIGYFRNLIGFLSYQPFTFFFMLFLLWCYHADYKGALYISHSLRGLVKSNPAVVKAMNLLHEKLRNFNLFESDPAIEEGKVKSQ